MDPRFRGIFFNEDGKPYVEVMFYKVEPEGEPSWFIGKLFLQEVEPASLQAVGRFKAESNINSFL